MRGVAWRRWRGAARYREQIVRKEEMERFRTLLMPHQLAVRTCVAGFSSCTGAHSVPSVPHLRHRCSRQQLLPDGMTVYDRSIVQHNMLAASRVYENVTFDELAVLLDVDPTKVRVACPPVACVPFLSVERPLEAADDAAWCLRSWRRRRPLPRP